MNVENIIMLSFAKLTFANQLIKLITINQSPQIEHFYQNYKHISI